MGASAPCTRGGLKHPLRQSPPGVTGLQFVSSQPHALVTSCARDTTLRKWDLRAASLHALETPLDVEDTTHVPTMVSTAEEAEAMLLEQMMRLGAGADPATGLPPAPDTLRRALDRTTAKGWQTRLDRSKSGVLRMSPEEAADPMRSSRRWGSSPGVSGLVQSNGMVYASATDGRVYSASMEQLDAPLGLTQAQGGAALTHPLLQGSSVLTPLAASQAHGLLAVGGNRGDVVLFDTLASRPGHAPSLIGGNARTLLGPTADATSHALSGGHKDGSVVSLFVLVWIDGMGDWLTCGFCVYLGLRSTRSLGRRERPCRRSQAWPTI